jgi:hypothetical protein
MVKPNTGRIIVELLKQPDGQIILPTRENIKAGENAYIGKVVEPGESQFKKGQLVMFAEYSMVGFYKDIKGLGEGTVSMSEMTKPENMYHVIAEMDVMAYDATTV